MKDHSTPFSNLPPEQQAIRAKCFHPSGTFVEFPIEDIETSISERFEKIVRMYPDRVAVKSKHHEMTYKSLNHAANRVARAILARRGEREEPVALLFEHGAPAIITILGILKAGKIYVPLDPLLPYSRTARLLEDSQAALIVTNNQSFSLAHELAQNGSELMNVDESDSSIPADDLGLSISPDTLAWIIHTSGSTGQPKGVVQNHRNVLHFVMNYTNSLCICADDRLTLLFSLSANAGAHNTVAALLNGAGLYLFNLKEEGLGRVAEWLVQEEITIYKSAATVFRHFLTTLTGAEEFPQLRLVYLGGEPVYKRDVQGWEKFFFRDCIFVNRLGSTETGSIRWYFIDKKTQIDGNNVPVGYPVEDNDILLLDDHGEEVGFNEIGEIAVRSRYLSPGYWRKPDRTREVFLSDPEGGSERIYRTGDLGQMLTDGCLLCLGRKDFQLKIRGHRIEVAEIEMALLQVAGIKEAVVVARDDVGEGGSVGEGPKSKIENRDSEKRLVAYLVADRQPAPTVSELRRLLAEKLPDYMIPSAWVFLDALPLAPNGKVDRRALPSPCPVRPELNTPFVAPRTPVEETLARIWAQVLGINEVGVDDAFFDLGGHSLQATQVISRIIIAFQVELPIRFLLTSPTIAEMAAVIMAHQGKKLGEKELTRILSELESLSDDNARRQLAGQGNDEQLGD